ncbi:MAG: hypothetical protein ABI477_00580 [Chryseolinea sp.]
MAFIKLILTILLFCILTLLTQIGGFVLLIAFLTYGIIDRKISSRFINPIAKVISYAVIYLIVALLVVPLLAKPLGRVPLPIWSNPHLKPAHVWTALLNRNYVKPQLKDIASKVSESMSAQYTDITVNYLDANFPFIDNFPLFPHRSHSDGKKLDISFQYNNRDTGKPTNDVPSIIGYGVCEEPKDKEENIAAYCEEHGHWQYSLLQKIVPQCNKQKFVLDEERTKDLVNGFASQKGIGRIFIERHLKKRLRIRSFKVRFQGCEAVRHDDHIHVQLK